MADVHGDFSRVILSLDTSRSLLRCDGIPRRTLVLSSTTSFRRLGVRLRETGLVVTTGQRNYQRETADSHSEHQTVLSIHVDAIGQTLP